MEIGKKSQQMCFSNSVYKTVLAADQCGVSSQKCPFYVCIYLKKRPFS